MKKMHCYYFYYTEEGHKDSIYIPTHSIVIVDVLFWLVNIYKMDEM